MTKQSNYVSSNLTIDTWKEELSRAKKFKEATQKRTEEIIVRKNREKNTEHRMQESEENQ